MIWSVTHYYLNIPLYQSNRKIVSRNVVGLEGEHKSSMLCALLLLIFALDCTFDFSELCESNLIWRPERPKFNRVGTNSSGWTMMFDEKWKISLCNPKRRLIRRITLPLLGRWTNPSGFFVSTFET